MAVVPNVKPGDAVGQAIKAALEGAVARIGECDPDARRGDSEGIHHLRTSTRRLRSELRAFQDLVEPQWRLPLERELKWLADLLGAVRDLDVLTARLRKAAANELGGDAEAMAPLFRSLEARHEIATRALLEGLRGERYRKLLVLLDEAIEHPQLKDEAWESSRRVLPTLATAAWRRVRKGAQSLRPSDPDAEFHELRKRAKRARYIAELVAPIIGCRKNPSANRFIRLMTQVQDTLGEHQDAVVAVAEIERCLAENADNAPLVEAGGWLLETQREASCAAKTAFFKIWDKLDRKKSTRWLKAHPKARA
jgi:CHAD domain-containing protein